MRTHARAVVIGGGVVGVSTLYHLAKKGWSDSVLVERKELTSGSTWHAAGLLPLFNLSYSVGQIHKYSVALYKTLEKETGLDVGFRQVSNIRLARTRDRMDEYHYYAGVAATIGVEVKFLTPQEVKEIWPLCNVDGIIGAIQHPEDGYIQPADLTQALARGARERGGEINRQTTVTAIERLPGGEWKVVNRQGRHRLRARRLGDRQFRAADRPHGRDQRAGDPGPASIYRHRGASRDPRAQGQGPAGDGGLARVGFLLVHARGGGRPAARALREGRAGLLCRRAVGGQRIRALSRKTSIVSRRISRRRSRACPPSARSASRRSITARSPIRPTARRSSARRRA